MLSQLARGWLMVLLLLPLTVLAQQTPAYQVEINGAGPYTDLLSEHLDIIRRQDDTGISEAEILRRVNATPSQIRELLATEGYFSAEVRQELDRTTTPWTARFDIDLGPPTMVESVDLRFRGALADGDNADPQRMRRLRQEWPLSPGDVFEQDAWNEAKNTVLRDLLVRDYPAATVASSQARIDPETNTAALQVTIDSGPVFTFGGLDLHGLNRYPADIIERVNPIRPGERYSQEKLNELQERLQETDYFRTAFATIEVDPSNPKEVPIRVDLAELPSKRLALGGGLSTDTGVRLQVRWLDRNFLDRAWRLESELLLDRETRLIGSELYLRPLSNGWQPSLNARLERSLSAGETNDQIRTGARLTSPNRVDEKTWAISLIADRQRVGNTFQVDRRALIGSFIYTKRRLDDPLTPRRGYVASAELGFGPRGLVNVDNIARVVVRGNLLYPLGDRLRVQARGQVGQLFGGSRLTVPSDLLFRTGGDQSVRGYGYETLGVPQNGAVVAGKVVAIASVELIYQVRPQWGAAVFTDAGDAADSWDTLDVVHGTGVGVRWSSPIGQVNVDLAYGHATREPRLHFSVGYGF